MKKQYIKNIKSTHALFHDIKNKMSNINFNLTNLDTNNINFDLSSNIKSEIMNENNPNEAENNFSQTKFYKK